MESFFNEMHRVHLQSDCSGAEGAFYALKELLPGKCDLVSSPLGITSMGCQVFTGLGLPKAS